MILRLVDIYEEIAMRMPGECIFIIGDMNARVGEFNNNILTPLQNALLKECRKSSDLKVNTRGKGVTEKFLEHDLILLNGRSLSDYPAAMTYISPQGSSVIDLCWSNTVGSTHVHNFNVLDIPSSPHLPICLYLVDITKTKVGLNVDDLNEAITFSVKHAATQCNMQKQVKSLPPGSRTRPWYDHECRKSRQKVIQSLKDLRRSLYTSQAHLRFTNARKEHSNLIQACSRQPNMYL
ncbi:unnamed protein product [Allacma fusca]|uniref:Endonuclease/exonuclease/phosphatase domain-containing protein n=1 Tax=Allacma fusca TaxID=39272 RepID=A0A8J2JMK9_9HEXA|nr:unnamed protein product [Allacma fusca]